MSSTQTAPQPPPPPVQLLPGGATNHELPPTSKAFTINICLWAQQWPELQKACYLSKVCCHSPPTVCRYKNIRSVLQKGPTCGLTALSMLMGGSPTQKQLLEAAKGQNYTHNGEMFSAKNMFQLISDAINEKMGNLASIKCQLFTGYINCAKVKDYLQNEMCILVAYDTDYNNAPGLKSGHKAHWALIIGFLIDEDGEFYVIARHGKSKNLAVWSLKDLAKSNSNLEEFLQPNSYPDYEFMLPEGGIGGELGLKEQVIIIGGMPNETVIVR